MITTLEKITIDGTDVFLDDLGNGQGKIIISNSYGENYSYYWGAMGTDLKSFIKEINASYFADKLLGYRNESVIDIKTTFKNLRNYIVNEMDLPYYKHMAFQKDMREKIKNFQDICDDDGGKYRFVDSFHSNFVNSLNFYLIDDSFDRDWIRRGFEGIDEHWHFLEEKPSPSYFWLEKFHKKLKKELK